MLLWRFRSMKRWALLSLLLLAGCSRGESPTSSDDSSLSKSPSAAPVFVPVDLQSHSKCPPSEHEGMPFGRRNFKGVEYQVGPILQVASRIFPNSPHAIEGIPIGKTCLAIHFLHSSKGGGYQQPGHPKHEADGVEIGQYLIHYTDGTQAIQPIVYGEQLRGWWDWDNGLPTSKSDVVWTGKNSNAANFGRKIRLYWTVWENPHPEKTLATIDFVSARAKAAPFCVAMTLETVP